MKKICQVILLALCCCFAVQASTRTLETRFALSADARSEFSTRFPILSEGRVVIEANWTSTHPNVSLGMALIEPDGTTVTTRIGSSGLRLDHNANSFEVAKYERPRTGQWIVKIVNDVDANRSEVSGSIRITVPDTERTLEDSLFTLLGSGNAQEFPFEVPSPGKLAVEVTWEPDVVSKEDVGLVVSLIHPGESRTLARRKGPSPIRIEQQVTEQALDRGERWIVRVQNDTHAKVGGRLRIIYTPRL